MKVMVAGAGGFIGARVLARFRGMPGVVARGVGRNLPDEPSVDLASDRATVDALVAEMRPDVIINAAGTVSTDMTRCFDAHVGVTINLLTAAAEHAPGARFVQLGSAAEYGDAVAEPDAMREDTLPVPQTAYGISKLASTLLAAREGPSRGLHAVALRIFNLVGPGMTPGTIFPNVLRFLATPGRHPGDSVLLGALDVYRDFVHIDDLITAVVAAAETGAVPNGSIINIASGEAVMVRRVVRELLDLAGHTGPIEERAGGTGRSSGVRWALGDNRRAQELLGWRPRKAMSVALRELAASNG